MCGFVKTRVSLAIVRANSLLFRGPCNKGGRLRQRPGLTDGAVMALLAPWCGLVEELQKGKKGWEEVKDSDMVWERSRCIARETSESAFSWDSEGFEKSEIGEDRNNVD